MKPDGADVAARRTSMDPRSKEKQEPEPDLVPEPEPLANHLNRSLDGPFLILFFGSDYQIEPKSPFYIYYQFKPTRIVVGLQNVC